MAGVSDYFSIGSVVACKTCYDKEIEGEVMAFDQQTKMLVLKCPSSSGDAKLHDVHIVNLSLVSDVQVKKEVSPTNIDPPQSLNLQRLSTRVRNSIEARKRMVKALQSGVSPEGQKLFIAISKTINETMWSGPDIVVFSNVVITPPYKIENVQGKEDCRAYALVRKMVERHTRDIAGEKAQQKEFKDQDVQKQPQIQKGTGTQ